MKRWIPLLVGTLTLCTTLTACIDFSARPPMQTIAPTEETTAEPEAEAYFPTYATKGLTLSPLNDGAEYEITGIGTAQTQNLILPESYNGKPVTRIGDGAFEATDIISVNIPTSIKSIGKRAFADCKSLKIINSLQKLEHIEDEAFYDCAALQEFRLGWELSTIGSRAFYGCTFRYMKLPNTMRSVGDGAFENCYRLTRLEYEGNNDDWRRVQVGKHVTARSPTTFITIGFETDNGGQISMDIYGNEK